MWKAIHRAEWRLRLFVFAALLLMAAAASGRTLILPPDAPPITAAGRALIVEYEGWAGRPELPDRRYSGVSWGWGWDSHQNSKANCLRYWGALPAPQAERLAETHPFYGQSAVEPTKKVRDIIIPRWLGDEVFDKIDLAKTYDECKRAFPGFGTLRPNAQAAVISLVFNRGASTVGANRKEMREMRDAIAKQDYAGIASSIRRSKRVWRGTSIQAGMTRRREAEARLVETP